jgi:MerR family transcriptional regulator, light-induced transcriptional regulator
MCLNYIKNRNMTEWHPIRVVARRTGLSPHVIRAWETRYGAIEPRRTETNRRMYSMDDVERLALLRRATLAGRSIGQIATLPVEELRALVDEDERAARSVEPATGHEFRPSRNEPSRILSACLQAVEAMDATALQKVLNRASMSLTRPVLMQEVIVPLMHRLGDAWRDGTVRVAHEHLATAVVRSFLGNVDGAFESQATSPGIVLTTPSGQLHELGALLAAATASSSGWGATYLGPNLPSEEVAAAASHNHARAVGLSIVYPTDDPRVRDELRKLRQLLDPHVVVIVGGRSAGSYRDVVEGSGMIYAPDLAALRDRLDALRSQS